MTVKNSAKDIETVLNSLDKSILKAKTLYDTSREILTFDLNVIHKMALYSSVGTLGASAGVFLTYDFEKKGFNVKYQLTGSIKKKFISAKNLFNSKSIDYIIDNMAIFDDDTDNPPELNEFIKLINASILIPIKIKNELYGVLALGAKIDNKQYTSSDIEFLLTLSSLITLSIENSESQKELNYKIFELSTLYEISKEFSSTLDITHIQTSIIFCCMGVVGAKRGAIFLFDNEDNSLCMNHAINFPAELQEGLRFKIDDDLFFRLTTITEPFFLSDLKKRSKEYKLFANIRDKLKVISNPLIIPQIIKSRIVGYLLLAEKINKNEYSATEIHLLSALSYQSSIAITNAQSFQNVMDLAKKNAALYEELKVATEEKLKSERLATLGMVVSTITHDIKNPLTSIRYFSAMLGEADLDAKSKKNYVEIIDSETDRLVGMIEELLDFAKGGGPLKIEKCSLSTILDEVFVVLERDFKDKNIDLKKEIKYSGTLYIDDEKIKRVLYNIAYNARDAMKKGGEIKFEVEKENKCVIINIIDNGQGIPDNILDTLFMPFVTYGKTKGTGLGLAISKKIIDDHHGEILFTTKKNKGTEFKIKLPINNPK